MAFGWAEWQGFVSEEQWEMLMQQLQKPDFRNFPESPSLSNLSYCLVLGVNVTMTRMPMFMFP